MFVLLLQLLKRTYVLGVSYIQDDVAGEGWAVLAPTQPAKPLDKRGDAPIPSEHDSWNNENVYARGGLNGSHAQVSIVKGSKEDARKADIYAENQVFNKNELIWYVNKE